MGNEPRILFIDIETAPIIAAVWKLYDDNAIWVERDSHLLSFAYKWSDTEVKTRALPDYSNYEFDKYDDFGLVESLFGLLDEADFVCAHNGARFDLPKINGRMLIHGFLPPSPYKVIDTLKLLKKFGLDSRKLDKVGGYLNVGRKVAHQGSELWRQCLAGDLRAWATMCEYNARDVVLLEGVFEKIRHWGGLPDFRPHAGVNGCPNCLSQNIQRRGFQVARKWRYQRLQCQDCSHWFQGERC